MTARRNNSTRPTCEWSAMTMHCSSNRPRRRHRSRTTNRRMARAAGRAPNARSTRCEPSGNGPAGRTWMLGMQSSRRPDGWATGCACGGHAGRGKPSGRSGGLRIGGKNLPLQLGDLAVSREGHSGRHVHAVIRPGLRKTEPELALTEGAAEPPREFVRPPRRPRERTTPRRPPESPSADGGDAGASEPDSGPAATESPRPAAEVARQKLSLARNYAAAGMTDKARDLVEAILNDYPDTSAADGAKALQQLAAEE